MSSHQQKELAAIREEARRKGWRVERGKGYWKMWCPSWCGKHWKTMHLSPSDPNYARNLRGRLGRVTCWSHKPPGDDEEGSQ